MQAQWTERAATAKRSYNNSFPSINATYTILENLLARASYSQTIGRPDMYNLVPSLQIGDPSSAAPVFQISDPNLKPWTSRNVSLSLEYYTDNLGNITLRAYRRWVKNAFYNAVLPQGVGEAILIDSFGLDQSIFDQYTSGYDIKMPYTIPGAIVNTGIELSGNYNFDKILPSWARGFNLRLNITRNTITGRDEKATIAFASQKLYLFPWTAGGRISFARKYYSIALSGKWNARQRQASWGSDVSTFQLQPTTPHYYPNTSNGAIYEPGTYEYLNPTFRLDLDIAVSLTKQLTLFINGRDINGYKVEWERYGPHTPANLKGRQQDKYEPVWTLGLKAVF